MKNKTMNNLLNYSIIQMPPSFTTQIYNTYFIPPNFFAIFFYFFSCVLGWYFFLGGIAMYEAFYATPPRCFSDLGLHPRASLRSDGDVARSST